MRPLMLSLNYWCRCLCADLLLGFVKAFSRLVLGCSENAPKQRNEGGRNESRPCEMNSAHSPQILATPLNYVCQKIAPGP